MSLHPIKGHHVHARTAFQRLCQHIDAMRDVCRVQCRIFGCRFARNFAPQFVEAVQVMEDVHAGNVCVDACGRFDCDGGVLAECEDVGRSD